MKIDKNYLWDIVKISRPALWAEAERAVPRRYNNDKSMSALAG